MEKHFSHKLILASGSPRRKQLLQEMGIHFEVKTKPEIAEDFSINLKNEEIAMFLSNHKFEQYVKDIEDDELFLTADTIVCLKGEVIGKPEDKDDAIKMLSKLSGNTHTVYTGITLGNKTKRETTYDATHVTFKKLESAEIEWYVNKYKPFDKAGAYGIQDWIGYIAIEKIEGSYYNVMGLPTHKVYELLQNYLA